MTVAGVVIAAGVLAVLGVSFSNVSSIHENETGLVTHEGDADPHPIVSAQIQHTQEILEREIQGVREGQDEIKELIESLDDS